MPTGTPFSTIEVQLDRSTLELLDRLVELHLNATAGKRQEFLWMRSSTFGADHEQLIWLGSERRGENVDFTAHDLQTLMEVGMFGRGMGVGRNPSYRVTQNAIRFYRWRKQHSSPTPIEQTETALRTLIDDPTALARRHPAAGRHLADAYELLWAEQSDDTIIKVGSSLRAALTAVAADLVGHTTNPEQVEAVLRPWLTEIGRLPPRHGEALAAHLGWVTKCTQRLSHLHDERSKSHPTPTWDEVRRTAFSTTLLCYELDRLTPSP